jgi:AAA+ superfamily predicted ATPase
VTARAAAPPPRAARAPYRDSHEHLADELRRLDLLIRLRVAEFRRDDPAAAGPPEQPHLYVSHAEVDRLARPAAPVREAPPEAAAIRRELAELHGEIAGRLSDSGPAGVELRLPLLGRLFGLSPLELQTVVICLAPELDRKYDRLYAYLQDDITRKKPSLDLVLDLAGGDRASRWRLRRAFSDPGPLARAGLVETTDDPQSPSGSSDLARFLKLDARVLAFLLGSDAPDARLRPVARVHPPHEDEELADPELTGGMTRLAERFLAGEPAARRKTVFYLHGPYGAGKRDLARAVSGGLGCPTIAVDVEALLGADGGGETALRLAFREGLLLQAALSLESFQAALKDDAASRLFLKRLAAAVRDFGWLTFLVGERPWTPLDLFDPAVVVHPVEVGVPPAAARERAWRGALAGCGGGAAEEAVREVSGRFRLTPGQIRDAVRLLATERAAAGGGDGAFSLDALCRACRRQASHKLGELAVEIVPRRGWGDLVLPAAKVAQLREVSSQVRHRRRVMDDWGFDRKLASGKGLSVLFSGPPGTGKTLAAEVLAGDLGLELYKIDLSRVVSKYIGETEKNLARIFHEAETSNAILFFDEADALFGKRTEVSDAHDRYANIETSYLLQKMEEHQGIVVLATNLRENLDDAFSRRITHVVEFPFPDAGGRLAIWRAHFPPEAPLAAAIEWRLVSERLEVAGGNIKNIALNAAYLAAENGGAIGMEHIARGARREFEKIGKLWNDEALRGAAAGGGEG